MKLLAGGALAGGALTAATLRVTGDVATLPTGTYRLIACTSIAGAETMWMIDAPERPNRMYRLTRDAEGILLSVSNAGTAILLR